MLLRHALRPRSGDRLAGRPPGARLAQGVELERRLRRPALSSLHAGHPLGLIAGGLVAFFATLVTSTAENWSAVAMRTEHGAGEAAAAATFTALGALGASVAALSPWAAGTAAGWVLVGAGLAAATPALIGAAPRVTALPVPAAIAAVTSISYLGSFTGPPAIGGLAEAAGLSAALGLAVAAALAMAALAGPGLRPAPSPQPRGGS